MKVMCLPATLFQKHQYVSVINDNYNIKISLQKSPIIQITYRLDPIFL